ncbi:MAG: amidohydrolase [Candidatus Marinimicrobia bacterium]|nr:amidohydrolase [Candidatus Neomarinimicrobiota bacterium]
MKLKTLLLSLSLMLSLSQSTLADNQSELYFIDAHSQVDHIMPGLDLILENMRNNNVKKTLLSIRYKRDWKEVVSWNKKHPDEIFPLISTKGDAGKNLSTIEAQIKSERMYGSAEFLAYHAKKVMKSGFVASERNHNLFKDKKAVYLLEDSLKNGYPFLIHIEFGYLWQYPEKRKWHMNNLIKLLEKHPEHPFILIHMGQLEEDEVSELLKRFSNLHFMMSRTGPIASGSEHPWTIMFDEYEFIGNWDKLLIKYPTKFIFALDNVFKKHWLFKYDERMEYWNNIMKTLPKGVAHAIAHGNAERLWNLK